ncbi:ABC-F family ATP-binding cassette domain-containing protein [Pullulanibacillus sp. KACC 23026]|uniref:ABC transporter ATP-binding protein n=1 Tax=Pullulanibacillus sp. KACC 23026 TaxID=3028315 RepID=UPI0023B046C5|nr:ABC-F family ATP-binding cassette domain-containing protein [Pullulanibacillus sp. KACC 23026]WEG12508.1 ABC-F family ATP-binding cassette domain-containing protein [Pullulanibacillus sp. KACC 23026]
MILLQTHQLTKSFGTDLILSNIHIEVQTGERVALVGRNGSGKSTLLKIIAGQMSYDSGQIMIPKETSIGYLEQNMRLDSKKTLMDELRDAFKEVIQLEHELRELEFKMAEPLPQEAFDQLMKTYDQKQTYFQNRGGYTYQAEINSVLNGLGFGDFPEDTKVHMLSGGQKTRLSLGRLLLTKPDLLILDEPTNHLDIDTLTWLENYLQHYPGAILIVSHDRYFLDKIVGKVFEISNHSATKYHGNYSAYLNQKALDFERDMQAFEKQQKEVAKLEDFVQRNIARASTTKRAQSRRKQLEKITLLDRPGQEKSAAFSFQIEKQSGNDVLMVQDLAIGYPDQPEPLSAGFSFQLHKTESVALVGPNGIGKSTLLKTIVGYLSQKAGNFTLGTNVSIGYYDQEQATLSSNKTVLAELWDAFPLLPEKDIRTVLGQFLFSGEDVLKTTGQLSGGEKARVALAKLMLQKNNFLILDEPTNHLDLDSKEVLENALIDYPGTLLFVSHDRYFINRIATRILELSHDGLTDYLGDYDYYIEKKAEMQEREALELQEAKGLTTSAKQQAQAPSYEKDKERKRRMRQLERAIEQSEAHIHTLEGEIETYENQLTLPEIYTDHEKANEIHQQLEAAREALDKEMENWEALQLEQEDE